MLFKCEVCRTRYAVCRVRSLAKPDYEYFYCRQCLVQKAEPVSSLSDHAFAWELGDYDRDELETLHTFFKGKYITALELFQQKAK